MSGRRPTLRRFESFGRGRRAVDAVEEAFVEEEDDAAAAELRCVCVGCRRMVGRRGVGITSKSLLLLTSLLMIQIGS